MGPCSRGWIQARQGWPVGGGEVVKRRLLATATLAILILVVAAGCGDAPERAAEAAEPVAVAPIAEYRPPVQTIVQSGDTIESVCRRLAGDDWVLWRDTLVGELDARRLLPGTRFAGTRRRNGELEEMRVILDRRSELDLRRRGADIEVHHVERPIEERVERLEGEITSSLFDAVESAGGTADLAVTLAEVFQWDVDFFRDLREGDSFVAVVNRESIDGSFYRWGDIFAARFVNRGRTLYAVLYPDSNGHLGYYDLEGRPLRKQFLRSPLKFSRITSRFSLSRFHPILKRRMPHYGVDYGAPVGTPVHVTADGVVTFTGRNGGAGRMVTVRHPNGYETSYLHLRGFGPGIRRGVRVVQGQVVGYVGSSGLSTAPHLDYRIKVNGRWTNPLTISSPPAKPLAPDRLQRFLAHSLAVLELLEGRDAPVGARG